jgi:hypothetical protein
LGESYHFLLSTLHFLPYSFLFLRSTFFFFHLAIQKYFHNFAAQKAILPIQDSGQQLLL